jgi:glutamate/tyrosine decarboxylase-like PLP-dependent enzyme
LTRIQRRIDPAADEVSTAAPALRTLAGPGHDATVPADFGLTLSPAQVKELLEVTGEHILTFQRELADGVHPASGVEPAGHRRCPQVSAVLAELREDAVPTTGTDIRELLDELFRKAMPNGTMHTHPGFMAHVPPGGLFQGAVGDFIARALTRLTGAWPAAPGLQQIEENVIRWFCTMLGYGPGSHGYLTTSGSAANFVALVCAVRRAKERGVCHPVLYVSAEGHANVLKAAMMAGLPAARVRVIGVGPDFALDTRELADRIAADRAAGLAPVAVVATAGTARSGAVDELDVIAQLCREERLWLHADACFGGFFRITARGRAALHGIEQADSISVDAHTSLFLPRGSSALLVKDRTSLRTTFEIPGAAYPSSVDEPDLAHVGMAGPDQSREIRGLTAWLPLKMHGVAAFERCLDEKLDLATYLADRLPAIPGIEVISEHPLYLPVVIFKLRGDGRRAEDCANARLCELICSHGNVYLTTMSLPGHGLVVRACILHPQTNRAVVDRLLDDVERSV